MQKIFFILLLSILIFGCDETEEGVIDPYDTEFSVIKIDAPTNLEYSGPETALQTSISFSDSKSILSAWIKVLSQDGTIDVTYYKVMSKADDNKYSTSITMDQEMPNLTYTIDYFVKTAIQSEKKIASHNFTYKNNQNNVAPVISNPLFYYENESPMLRDTLVNNKNFIFSIVVSDSNGLSDIDSVYTDFYNPANLKPWRVLMYDDGKSNHGDKVAGDGIYSFLNSFKNASGNRKFIFIAKDRAGFLSNVIEHNVEVK